MRFLGGTFLAASMLLLAGCATKSYLPGEQPEYIVIQDFSPFYLIGPMQARGPDASLPKDTRVTLVRQESGYSRVQLSDNRTGYVANEHMAPAPPPPPPPKITETRKRRGSGGARYTGEQVNDTPLPDAPSPDLNIAPEDVPVVAPAPTPPVEKPKFRF